MKKEDLRIVYMGTPEFAVGSLRALVEGGYNVVGVVTMPDKPVGRHGSVLQASDVKQYAVSVGLPVLQPVRLKDESFLEELKALKADLQIVVAFRMLPEVVWNMPPLGTFNLHGSLLPQYRGAAPINRAIINGDTETGVTTFFLAHEIDTGKIIKQIKINVEDTDNAGIVHDKLMNAGAKLVLETVDLLLNGQIEAIEQNTLYTDPEKLLPAPKIFKDTCRIDWMQPLKRIYDFIRGLSPYPAAWTELESIDGNMYTLKIYEAKKIYDTHPFAAGTIRTDGKSYLNIAVQDGFLQLISVQLAGKKQMNITDFLNGFKQIEKYKIIKPKRKMKNMEIKSFSDYKSDASNWITLAGGEYYPDILKDACTLYKPVLVLFGQLVKSSESSSRLFFGIMDVPESWLRVQLLRVFKRYVCPVLPVEMTKRKTKAAEFEKEFNNKFRPINEVQKAFNSRPLRDEVMCALLWEYKDRGKKGYDLTERFFELFRSNFSELQITGPERAGKDILMKDIFADYPNPNRPIDFVIKDKNEILAIGLARYDSDRGGAQEDDRTEGYSNCANEFLEYTKKKELKTKLIFINDGPGLLLGSMWNDYATLEKSWKGEIMVLTLRMVTERISKEWLNTKI